MTLQTTIDNLKANNDALDADITTAESGNAQTRTDFETAKADTDTNVANAPGYLATATQHREQAQQAEAVAAAVEADTVALKDAAVSGVTQAGTVADNTEAVAVSEQALATAEKAKAIARVYGQPSLELDFVNQRYTVQSPLAPWLRDDLDPATDLTFTRASTKWVFDATGTLVEVPIDTMAIDHDPVTGESLGVLLEGGATNEWPWSDDMSQLSGYGTVRNVSEVLVGTGTGDHHCYPYLPSLAGLNRTLSFRIKQKGTQVTHIRIVNLQGNLAARVDLGSGAVSDSFVSSWTGSGGAALVKTTQEGDGWIKVSAQVTMSTSAPRIFMDDGASYSFTGDGVSGFYLKNMQIEESPYPTSYIPTAGAAVTRAADSLLWYVGDQFRDKELTAFVSMKLGASETCYGFDSIRSQNINSDRTAILFSPGKVNFYVFYDTSNNYEVGFSWSPGDSVKAAHVFSHLQGERRYGLNGATGSKHYISEPSSPTKFFIGSRYSYSNPGGHIREFALYPRALTEAELAALTTLPV